MVFGWGGIKCVPNQLPACLLACLAATPSEALWMANVPHELFPVAESVPAPGSPWVAARSVFSCTNNSSQGTSIRSEQL